jgi:hypothetical protein
MADRIPIEVTPGELAALQTMRGEHAIADAVGQPMPYDESTRAWGEVRPSNPASVQRLPTMQQWRDKQIGNLQAVGETNYRIGITKPRKDPIQAGIDAQPAYETAMRDPKVLARRAINLGKTNMQEWASNAENIGAARLVQGVVSRIGKVERSITANHGKMTQHLARIDAMPNAGPGDRERRMVENLRGLRAFKDS